MVSYDDWPQLRVLSKFFIWREKGLLNSAGTVFIMVLIPCLFVAEMEQVVVLYRQGDFYHAMQPLNEATSLLLFYVAALFVVICRNGLEDILNLIDDLNESTIAEVGLEASEEIQRRKRFTSKMHKVFLCVFVLLVTPWCANPILKLILTGERDVVVHSWLPFDNSYILGYFTNYIFHSICGQSYAIAHTMFSSVYAHVCEMIFGHLKILRYRFENLKFGLPSTNVELISCIKHQKDILKIIDLFQKITMVTLIAECIFTTLLICLILVDLTNNNQGSLDRVFGVIAESQTVLVFLGIFCWYGNEITYQCGILSTSCYFADWYNGTTSEKKLLLCTMLRASKPVFMGGFVRIDCLTFINILKGAFSYYNVLTAETKISN